MTANRYDRLLDLAYVVLLVVSAAVAAYMGVK